MQTVSLPASNPYPPANALQILQGNRASGALRGFDKLLADIVVGMGSKAAFSARQSAQLPFGSLTAVGLQLPSQATVAVAHMGDGAARIIRTVAIGRQFLLTQVNAQHVVNILGVWLVNLAGGKQVELSTNIGQVALAALRLQQFPIALFGDKRNGQSPANCPNR